MPMRLGFVPLRPYPREPDVTPDVLVVIDLPPWGLDILAGDFTIHHAPTDEARQRLAGNGQLRKCRAVVTNGSVGLTAAAMAAMPGLEIICVSGAGYDRVDLEPARARGIAVTNGPATNDVSVTDHAFALMLDIARGIAEGDRAIRRGDWEHAESPGSWEGIRAPRPLVSGKRLGIVGLGNIGMRVARRAELGFDMTVAYHNRRPRPDVPYAYHADAIGLAEESDFLLLTCPGGPQTHHLVNAEVLHCLGKEGFLVNVSRGSVVDTAALTAALGEGTIAGAALDVVEGEPLVPADLLAAPNLVVTPHLAGRAPEAVRAFMKLVRANLDAHFAGRPLLTPVLRGEATHE